MMDFDYLYDHKKKIYKDIDSSITLLLGTLRFAGDMPDMPFGFVFNGFDYENYREDYISSMKKFFEFPEVKAVRFIPEIVFCGAYCSIEDCLDEGEFFDFPPLFNPGLKDEVIKDEVSDNV